MILGSGCLGARALDGAAIRGALRQLGMHRVLLVASGNEMAALRGIPAVGVRVPLAEVEHGLDVARAAGCGRLLLELPKDLGLEAACRRLFDLSRGEPGLVLTVVTPDGGPCAAPDVLRLLLDDLSSRGVGYWHRPSRARLAGVDESLCMDEVGRYLVGVSLDDVAGRVGGLPPGTGELSLRSLAESLVSSLDVALDVDAMPDWTVLRFTLEELARAGFP